MKETTRTPRLQSDVSKAHCTKMRPKRSHIAMNPMNPPNTAPAGDNRPINAPTPSPPPENASICIKMVGS